MIIAVIPEPPSPKFASFPSDMGCRQPAEGEPSLMAQCYSNGTRC